MSDLTLSSAQQTFRRRGIEKAEEFAAFGYVVSLLHCDPMRKLVGEPTRG